MLLPDYTVGKGQATNRTVSQSVRQTVFCRPGKKELRTYSVCLSVRLSGWLADRPTLRGCEERVHEQWQFGTGKEKGGERESSRLLLICRAKKSSIFSTKVSQCSKKLKIFTRVLKMLLCFFVAVVVAVLDKGVTGDSGGDFFKTRTFINPGRPGPWIYASRGEVWPKPQMMNNRGKNFSMIHPGEFVFQVSSTQFSIISMHIIKLLNNQLFFDS